MDAPILEMQNIVKIYGGTKALDNANLKIRLGEVHALMGGNGAGKSTIIGIIAGSKTADGGRILYQGEEIELKTPRDALQRGIAVVYQELSLIPHLTIAENIALIKEDVQKAKVFDQKKAEQSAQKALDMLGEAAEDLKPSDIVMNLRADQKQMVELARALSLDAKIILLDEPTSSLNFKETQQLFEVVRRLTKQGIGIIFVSHKMDELRQISDRITIFRNGQTVVDDAAMSEKTDEEIIADMLGRKMGSIETMDPHAYLEAEKNPELLNIKYDGIPLEISLHEGEVIGLAGLAGSGRSSLLRCIWGSDQRDDIHMTYLGKPFAPKNPKEALDLGIAYMHEDRNQGGLFHVLPMLETVVMPHRITEKQTLVNNRENEDIMTEAIEYLKIKIPDRSAVPGSLSGGNQQKLLFGRWVHVPPKVFLLDDPTRGVDVYTKQDIYKLIHGFAEENHSGVIVVSSELAELTYLCHKVFVMKDGTISGMLEGGEITEPTMMAHVTSSASVQ